MTVTRTLLSTHVVVEPNTFAVVLRDGAFHALLTHGRHSFLAVPRAPEVREFVLVDGAVESDFLDALLRERPELADGVLERIRTDASEVALVRRDGRLVDVVRPACSTVANTVQGALSVERLDVSGDLAVPRALAMEIARVSRTMVVLYEVAHGHTGLLFVDGALVRRLAPGVHAFLNVGRPVFVKSVDLRETALDVGGQEVMTLDRVSVRLNLVAEYRVTDPERAVSAVSDFADALRRAVAVAARRVLTTRTLDEVLARKGAVDAEAEAIVREAMADTGVAVGSVVLKDVILPGEVRDILNTVIAAEKEAEANVIRRREETQATRALLNTARVMAENPAMLRLKELEALETIAGKVDRLTVHNGTRGLLDEVASLAP